MTTKPGIELNASSEQEAREKAIQISKQNPGRYVTVFACFGLFASVKKQLNVFEPHDSAFSWYVLNGEVKQFTERQIGAAWEATPHLS